MTPYLSFCLIGVQYITDCVALMMTVTVTVTITVTVMITVTVTVTVMVTVTAVVTDVYLVCVQAGCNCYRQPSVTVSTDLGDVANTVHRPVVAGRAVAVVSKWID